jgi:predicted transport protein
MPVFQTRASKAVQLEPVPFASERELQRYFEDNLEELLGVRFIATEVGTGEKHGGRIDTLGLDEEGNPVIIEYKWDKSDSVINQGLFYLDWLLDHRGDFELRAQKTLGHEIDVPWQAPRLILVASTYTKYDGYAVNRLTDRVQLLRYQRYSDGTFVLDSVNEPLSPKRKALPPRPVSEVAAAVGGQIEYTLDYHRDKTNETAWAAFLDLRERVLELDGVEERVNQKSQITFRTTKSFAACDPKKTSVRCQFKGPETIDDPQRKAKDIRSYRWGYEWAIELRAPGDVEYAFKLVRDAYEREH